MMNRIDLENKIKYYAKCYYEGNPEISDAEFDNLVDELREVYPNSYVLKSVGWGSGVENEHGKKVQHKFQLIGSLNKIKEFDKIPNFSNPVLSAKLDGLSAVAYYDNGNLVRAVTRGNGTTGIDITDKLIRILNGKTTIDIDDSIAVRGELVISNKNWELMKESDSTLKNSRNAAAGIINRNDITDDIEYISFVVYNIIGHEDGTKISQDNIYEFLERNFDNVCPHNFGSNGYYEGKKFDYELIEGCYSEYCLKYPCDGVVIGDMIVNHDERTDAMVYNQIAFKFKAEIKETTVRKVRYNLTRTGKLVPVIEVEPVELSGATVSRCSGFNAMFIKDNKICEGTVITLMRSGEVIPDLQKVVSGNSYADLPSICPVCGGDIEWNGVDLVCSNPDCMAKDYRDLECWINNIGSVEGIGSTLKFKFLDEIGIETVEQLYSKRVVLAGPGAQRELFRKVLERCLVEDIDAVSALCALNIPRLGMTTATKLAEHKELVQSCLNEILGEPGYIVTDLSKIVGNATYDSIRRNYKKFARLDLIWNRIVFHEKVDKSNLIKVAITGKLSMKRSDFEKLLQNNGFELAGVSKGTKYLITDEPNSGSSKNVKADQLGIEKITEADFRSKYNF